MTVHGLIWEPGAQLELLQFLDVSSPPTSPRWGVLGSLTIPPSSTDSQILAFPCGVVSRGGKYGVRLSGISEVNNMTRKNRTDFDIDKVGMCVSCLGI